jgi:hypothetical protein
MLSESARVTTAAEQRYRIDAPNALPRRVKVVALDAPSAQLVDRLSTRPWSNATFLALPDDATATSPAMGSLKDWMHSVAGEAQDLINDVDGTDVMVIIAHAEAHAQPAIPIGEACAVRGIPVVGIVIQDGNTPPALETVNALRPFTTMLVMASSEDYVEAMLSAFNA